MPRAAPNRPATVDAASSSRRHASLVSSRVVVVLPHRTSTGVAERHLQSSPFDVRAIVFSRRILDELVALDPDVVILENTGAGELDLVRLCGDVAETVSARILVVSSEADAADQSLHTAALDAGADDFLAASVSQRVFQARVRAALRGKAASGAKPELLAVGDVIVDLEAHVLSIGGTPVNCPPLQFALLVALARTPNRVVERAALSTTVWGTALDAARDRRLRVAVSALRRMIGEGPDRPRVETVPNVGYRLVVDHPRPSSPSSDRALSS